MWFLTSPHDTRVIYILPQKEIVIGRSVDSQYCNFAVPDDASISRKHASLTVSNNVLYLQDLGSKYGTFINHTEKLECNSKHKVQEDDIIKFGKINSEWKVHYINFTSCSSTLKGENLQSLKKNLDSIGGTLKSDWDASCVYLTMPSITLTIKVVLALVQGAYIVTTEFWKKCIEAVTEGAALPDPKNYVPHIVESTLNKETVSFSPNNDRKNLFAGKTVVFFSRRQLDMYKTVLVSSSASTLLLSESKMTKSLLCNDNIIVIQYNLTSTSQETQTQKNQISEILAYLKSKGKRAVADAEIGLAVLYCSLKKYCNPDFNFSSEIIKQASGGSKQTNVIANESEEPVVNVLKTEKVLIDESLISNMAATNVSFSNTSAKRKCEEKDNESSNNPAKKIDTESAKECNNKLNSNKRLYDDTENTNKPPKKVALEGTNNINSTFDFVETSSTGTTTGGIKSKLNLSKPLKRKQAIMDIEDNNLFNFVDNNPKPTKLLKEGANECDDTETCSATNTGVKPESSSVYEEDKFDVGALRGIKLEELLQSNLKLECNVRSVIVKTEDATYGESNDLGSTILNLRNDLIIKKEPQEVMLDESHVKNFKKFKKVWPVKMQISVLSKGS